MFRQRECSAPRAVQSLMQALPVYQSQLLVGFTLMQSLTAETGWKSSHGDGLSTPWFSLLAIQENSMHSRWKDEICSLDALWGSRETLHTSSLSHCPWKSHEWGLNCDREMCTLTGPSRADGSVVQRPVILWTQPRWPLNPPLPLSHPSASVQGQHILKLFLFHACELDTTMKTGF